MRLIALTLAACSLLSAQDASIDGLTVNAATGQPMPGVHVKFFTGLFGPGYDAVKHSVYGALSDSKGHFSIHGMAPGDYFYSGEFTGFVTVQKVPGNFPYPGMVVKPGDHLADFHLELAPRAILSGHVTDELGDPAVGFRVQLISATSPGASFVSTDDRGEFRIPAAPGKYRVKATPPSSGYSRSEIRLDGSSAAVYAPTYFPSVTSEDRATEVDAGFGAEIAGLDIRLARERTISITGNVSGIPPGVYCYVTMRMGDKPDRLLEYKSITPSADGNFTIPYTRPAYINMYAATSSDKHLQSRIVELKPSDSNISGVELALTAGTELAGTISLASQPLTGIRSVSLQPVGAAVSLIYGVSATTNSEGAFRMPTVFPAVYRVKLQPAPENSYIAKVFLDNVESAKDEVDLNQLQAGSKLKIAVATDGAEISGTLRDSDGQPVLNSEASVFLVQGPLTGASMEPVNVTKQGTFTIRSIRPGKYRLMAIDVLRSGALKDLDTVNAMLKKLDEIEIAPAARLKLDVKVFRVEGANAK